MRGWILHQKMNSQHVTVWHIQLQMVFSGWYRILDCIYSISIKKEHKRKKLCPADFCAVFSTTASFCNWYLPAFHGISFTKPFPSLGLGNRLRWQSNLFSSGCHTKWAQWEDMEGNCIWPREWQISDWELNKSAQVLIKIPAQDLYSKSFNARRLFLYIQAVQTGRSVDGISNHYVCQKAFIVFAIKINNKQQLLHSEQKLKLPLWNSQHACSYYLELVSNKRKMLPVKYCEGVSTLLRNYPSLECHYTFPFLERLNQ